MQRGETDKKRKEKVRDRKRKGKEREMRRDIDHINRNLTCKKHHHIRGSGRKN